MAKRCVIIGAATILNYDRVKSYLRPDDFFIFCDGGLNHAEKLGVKPDLIVGDFDSHIRPRTSTEIIQLPREKDDTDSFFACKEGARRGFSDFLLIGMLGQRFDHSLVNISILLYLKKLGKQGLLVDDYSEMEILSSEVLKIPEKFAYFSLLCIAGDVSGVNIKNAKYPLENGIIKSDFQYACSNEVLPSKTAEVSVENGWLLLVKVF